MHGKETLVTFVCSILVLLNFSINVQGQLGGLNPDRFEHENTPTYSATGLLKSEAGESCMHLFSVGMTNSGVYWLKPKGVRRAYQGYCDMTTYGGGWLVCYTDDDQVHMRQESSFTPSHPFATKGYRSNCMNYPYNEVLYFDHSNNELAYFTYDGKEHEHFAFRVASSEVNIGRPQQTGPWFAWTGHGKSSKGYKYQLAVCPDSSIGLFMSGVSAGNTCYKTCSDWCTDDSTDFYRMSGGGDTSNAGTAFRENGNRPLPRKLISVAIRYRGQEPFEWSPPQW